MKFISRRPPFYFYFEDVTNILTSTEIEVANGKVSTINIQFSLLTPPSLLRLFAAYYLLGPSNKLTGILQGNVNNQLSPSYY